MPTSPIEIRVPAGTIDCFHYRPEGSGPWPGVLMLPDIMGPRPAFATLAERLAGEGYSVLVPNQFYRLGKAPVPDLNAPPGTPDTRKMMRDLLATLGPREMRSDGRLLCEALLNLTATARGPIAVVGYCMSGQYAIYAAEQCDIVAAVASFHGGFLIRDDEDSPHRVAAKLKARLYFAHADQDPSIPFDRLDELRANLEAGGVEFVSEVYEGAGHGFAVPGHRAYTERDSERHFKALLSLLSDMGRH